LMTQKPILYIANVSEEQLSNPATVIPAKAGIQDSPHRSPGTTLKNTAGPEDDNKKNDNFVPISAKIEAELNELTDSEKAEYLETLGIKNTGLNELIKEAYKTLGLITYFTSGEKETRAWTIRKGDTAPIAAGAIHTDFTKGFIAAEIVQWADFYAQGGWTGAKTHGLVRTEGKTYVVKDGDTIIFKFNN